MDDLKAYIREVPDFPKPGINFYDITTLLKDPHALRMTVDRFAWMFTRKPPIDKVVGIESRGFMFAPTLAYNLNAGFVPVRKPGKLPGATLAQEYALEYGSDRIEVCAGAIAPGTRVLLIDDVLATGGTLAAALLLARRLEAEVLGAAVLVELDGLGGRQRWPDGLPLQATLAY